MIQRQIQTRLFEEIDSVAIVGPRQTTLAHYLETV
jgi:hypothetical protein